MSKVIVPDKSEIRADDPDITEADVDLYKRVTIQPSQVKAQFISYITEYSSLKISESLSGIFRSVPISANAYVIRMKWGDWAKILSSVSAKPFRNAT